MLSKNPTFGSFLHLFFSILRKTTNVGTIACLLYITIFSVL